VADVITFQGETLLDSTEGTYQFTLGSIGRDMEPIKLARGAGLLVADLGTSGAEHRLTVTFVVPTASKAGIRSRIQAFHDSATDGTLVIPDETPIENCVLMGKAEWSPQQKVNGNKYRMVCSMTFTQLR
jgi:hypothetical protein